MEPAGEHRGLELGLDLLQLRIDGDQVGELLGGHPAAGLAGDVAGPDSGEHRLGLQGGEVSFALAGEQLGEQPLEPVDGLDALAGQLVASVGEHPQRLELTIGGEHAKTRSAHGDDRDRVRVQGVGLAVVAGVEEPDPGGQLGRDIEDPFAGLDQPLGQRTAGAVGSLDRPDPVRPGPDIASHRGISRVVGGEPARPEQPFWWSRTSMVADSLWGSTPMITPLHLLHLAFVVPIGTARWAVLLRAGQSPLEPRLVTVSDEPQSR